MLQCFFRVVRADQSVLQRSGGQYGCMASRQPALTILEVSVDKVSSSSIFSSGRHVSMLVVSLNVATSWITFLTVGISERTSNRPVSISYLGTIDYSRIRSATNTPSTLCLSLEQITPNVFDKLPYQAERNQHKEVVKARGTWRPR